MKLKTRECVKLDLQMSPLIDVVFLLLIYFMVTAALVRKEADLGFSLPSLVGPIPVELPVELMVEIGADGSVMLEGMRFEATDKDLDGLVRQVARLKYMATVQQSDFYVNLRPEDEALHCRVVDVMDACVEAGVKKLGFAQS